MATAEMQRVERLIIGSVYTSPITMKTSFVVLPNEFGASWSDFERDWCLNAQLKYSSAETIQALMTLKRIWPEHVNDLVTHTARGITIIVPSIELGALLCACELTEGFQPVFNRLKNGERAAYSEMVLVSALLKLGHKVSFAAPLEGKNLDAKCEIEGQPVYFEVTAPEKSDFNIESQKLVNDLSNRLAKSISACRIEVELFRPLKPDEIQTIVEVSHIMNTGEWTTVGSIGRIRKVVAGQILPPSFDGDGAQIEIPGEADVKGDLAYAIIRLETSDNRAKRIFNEEYHHFSKRTANILVVNVSAVAGGFSDWESLMVRLLQPNQNRKVGAIILFDQGITGPPEGIRRRWRVIVNPYAHIKIPVSLVEALSSLDEP